MGTGSMYWEGREGDGMSRLSMDDGTIMGTFWILRTDNIFFYNKFRESAFHTWWLLWPLLYYKAADKNGKSGSGIKSLVVGGGGIFENILST